VAQNVEVTVVGADPKALIFGTVPLVEDFLHLEDARVRYLRAEAERPFVGLISGVTLDLEAHLCEGGAGYLPWGDTGVKAGASSLPFEGMLEGWTLLAAPRLLLRCGLPSR
jgi:hypothetical protein